MDCIISSNLNKRYDHHAQAWQSAADAELAAARKLMAAALQHGQNYPSGSKIPADYAHYQSHLGDPLAFFPKKPSTENRMPCTRTHESSGAFPKKPSTENSILCSDESSGARENGEGAEPTCPDDVVLLVGNSRQIFHLRAETLISGSAYFKHLLQHSQQSPALLPSPLSGGLASPPSSGQFACCPPIVIDCEERIFEGLLMLMRYGTLEALPPMTAAELFRLKKEAEFYGIRFMELPPKDTVAAGSDIGDDHSDRSLARSRSSSPTGSPKSMINRSSSEDTEGADRHKPTRRYHEGARVACSTSRALAELPDFPPDLADPARLVLVSCLDPDKASIYTCDCNSRQAVGSRTQWALNFHHRHAFCTSCGQPPNVSPKHFAEMFMAAAVHHSSAGLTALADATGAWWVGSDSTCVLRFVSSAGDGRDACSCSAGGARAAKEVPRTVWAANCFYSHAFCTCCGQAANGRVLLSLLLALRYGGTKKVSRSGTSSFRIPREKVV